jgi:DNA-binding transcriptional regulator PaaX
MGRGARQELERLTRAGLLRQERPDGDQRVYYARTDSPLWEIVKAAEQVMKRDAPGERWPAKARKGMGSSAHHR